jgi:hypothetical protein
MPAVDAAPILAELPAQTDVLEPAFEAGKGLITTVTPEELSEQLLPLVITTL